MLQILNIYLNIYINMQTSKKYTIIASLVVAVIVVATAPGVLQAQMQHEHEQQAAMSTYYMPHTGKTIIMHITSGDPEDAHQVHAATMGVDHAYAWHKAGMNTVIFLDVEGVLIGAKEVPTELSSINKNLKQFLAEGGRVIACSHCIQGHGLTPEDMLPSIEIDTHPNMVRIQDLLRSGATVLDY